MEIEKLLGELTLDEKCALTAGADMWTTPAVDRIGIPAIKMTDGPNGARGSALFGGGVESAACVPCGSALGATWDAALVEEVGALVGEEARTKACRVLLAPTINLHRSPLGGRNFECYSEDPLLSGRTAAAFIRGAQSHGVITTAKHFVANDSEFERGTISAVVDERALRELYLLPFELAVREGGTLGVMTAYNRLNGTYCAEHDWLLRDVLRGEWGFDGIVVTDWFAAGSTVGSARAGLDIEMPGPARFFGPALAAAVRAGDVDEQLVDEQIRRFLTVLDRVGALTDPLHPEPERSVDRTEHRAVARRAAADAMVLLRNDGVLPFDAGRVTSLAVIGPNADRARIMGGGSANLRPHYFVTPLEALCSRVGDAVTVVHEPGCVIDRGVPALSAPLLTTPDGEAGIAVDFYADADLGGDVVHHAVVDSTRFLFFGPPAPEVPESAFSLRARGVLTPTESGPHAFTLVQAGRARLVVDGVLVLDGFTDPPPRGTEFFGLASEEMSAVVDLVAARPVEVTIEYSSRESVVLRALQVGCRQPVRDDLIDRAVTAAAASDAVVVVVGTTDEWESEGRDRDFMELPGAQDELIERVLAANPNTVVVVNTGAPVSMPWADRAPAVLQSWLGGQEMANAIADVVFGDAEPGGRLPTTLPLRLEHNPSFGNFPGENSRIRYGEGVLVGYRWYEARQLPVRFPFGHGLSYTTFDLGPPSVSPTTVLPAGVVRVTVPVANGGDRAGSTVVQCYVSPDATRLVRPPKELKAFAKVRLDPGASCTVDLVLDARSFAYWDPGDPDWDEVGRRGPASMTSGTGVERRKPGWYADAGCYELHIGQSSADIDHVVPVTIAETTRLDP